MMAENINTGCPECGGVVELSIITAETDEQTHKIWVGKCNPCLKTIVLKMLDDFDAMDLLAELGVESIEY